MRDRLVELIQNSVNGCARHWAEVIADHLIANGVIVPPCKVGDTVWVYDFMWGLIPCKGDRPYHCICGEEGGCTFKMSFTDDDFGKTVFLTREEAEQALAERCVSE